MADETGSKPEKTRSQGPATGKRAKTKATSKTATKPRPAEPKHDEAKDQLPPWNVWLHNDDVNEMGEVVQSICMILRFNKGEAMTRMLEAHHRGLSLLLSTHQERAELIRDQFRSRRLKVTIEPAP